LNSIPAQVSRYKQVDDLPMLSHKRDFTQINNNWSLKGFVSPVFLDIGQ
jgi:hypothetical protein